MKVKVTFELETRQDDDAIKPAIRKLANDWAEAVASEFSTDSPQPALRRAAMTLSLEDWKVEDAK